MEKRPGPRRNDRDNLRNQIRARVMARWPEIGNPFHPAAMAALTREAAEIVKTIESDPAFKQWDAQIQKGDEQSQKSFDLERKWVKCQRFLYVSESVALEANLPSFGGKLVQAKYEALRAAENGTVGNARAVVAR